MPHPETRNNYLCYNFTLRDLQLFSVVAVEEITRNEVRAAVAHGLIVVNTNSRQADLLGKDLHLIVTESKTKERMIFTYGDTVYTCYHDEDRITYHKVRVK